MKGEGILHKTPNDDFRYYMHEGASAFSFELAGRLSDDGARELQLTAQNGRYLAPLARILLAIAYLREHKDADARTLGVNQGVGETLPSPSVRFGALAVQSDAFLSLEQASILAC